MFAFFLLLLSGGQIAWLGPDTGWSLIYPLSLVGRGFRGFSHIFSCGPLWGSSTDTKCDAMHSHKNLEQVHIETKVKVIVKGELSRQPGIKHVNTGYHTFGLPDFGKYRLYCSSTGVVLSPDMVPKAPHPNFPFQPWGSCWPSNKDYFFVMHFAQMWARYFQSLTQSHCFQI